MVDDRSIIIKKSGKGWCIVIWDRNDYLMEAEKQLIDKKACQELSNSENILSKLAEMSSKMVSNVKKRGYITVKQLKYFSNEYGKARNFGKLYFLINIHKSLYNVPDLPVILNCDTPTEKCSEFFIT